MPGKTFSVALASATQQASHALTREPATPFPAEAPFPTPSQDTWYPPTHAWSPDMCVLRSQADRARSGGPRRHRARRHHVHRHLPRLRHPHRRQRSPASSSLAPRSSAPRSSALSSLAGTSLVGASLVDASLASASLAGASLGSQHLYLFWRQTAGARRGTRRLARGCASAREVRERARGCVSAREDARARGEDVAGRGTCSAVWLGPLLRGRS